MNFARDVVEEAAPDTLALVELARDGSRREWSFGEVADAAARVAGTLVARGIGRGDVVMTLIGNRPEWVLTMVACFRLGAVALPCTEQLRPKDLALRVAAAAPRLIVADPRNRAALHGVGVPTLLLGDDELLGDVEAPAAELGPEDPCLVTFTSGTSGPPKAGLHGQRYLTGQPCRPRTGSTPARASSCGAPRRRAGRSRRATCSSPRGCGARPPSCTTPASMRSSAWRSSPASASASCAWPRRSTA